jgi:hypothetical protein
MSEHSLYRMWKDRLEAEIAREAERGARRAIRESERAAWDDAWRTYKSRLTEAYEAQPKPRWWDLLGWARWLLRLHSPN